jgi:hypothetical protein
MCYLYNLETLDALMQISLCDIKLENMNQRAMFKV